VSYSPDLAKVGGTASALLATTGPIGAVAAGVLTFMSSIGINLKGGTPHLNDTQGTACVVQFVGPPGGVWPLFQKAYTYAQRQQIAFFAKDRFLQAMAGYWGTTSDFNIRILNDVQQHYQDNEGLNRLLCDFMYWVSENVDSSRLQDEFNHVVPTYFNSICLGAITDAGLDIAAIGGTTVVTPPGEGGQVIVTPPNVTPTVSPKKTVTTAGIAGNMQSILFIGLIIGGLVLFMQGRKGGKK